MRWSLIWIIWLVCLSPTTVIARMNVSNAFAVEVQIVAPPISLRLTQNGMTLDEAVAMVRRQTGGKIIRAETKTNNGRQVHVIKVLTKEGKVRTFRIEGPATRR